MQQSQPLTELDIRFLRAGGWKVYDFSGKYVVADWPGARGPIQLQLLPPGEILRVWIRGKSLDDMLEEDYDFPGHQRENKGHLSGGKQRQRDRLFGKSDEFWEWWHRSGKPHYGKDIESQEEADTMEREYLDSLRLQSQLLNDSVLYAAISELRSPETQEKVRGIFQSLALKSASEKIRERSQR
ncbi:MAG: hypothetical protein KDJ24_08545 [Gammaproteobacteria bacterium]|nr:hypothetical protein [Gammaproteobacteria bacterium]